MEQATIGIMPVEFPSTHCMRQRNFKVNAFQTGRLYTKHGQRIAWIEYLSGIVFYDHDRMLTYWLENCAPDPDAILCKYDRCQYAYTTDEVNLIGNALERFVKDGEGINYLSLEEKMILK